MITLSFQVPFHDYKYTVNVGEDCIRVTGRNFTSRVSSHLFFVGTIAPPVFHSHYPSYSQNTKRWLLGANLDLVRTAKLVLDEYFSLTGEGTTVQQVTTSWTTFHKKTPMQWQKQWQSAKTKTMTKCKYKDRDLTTRLMHADADPNAKPDSWFRRSSKASLHSRSSQLSDSGVGLSLYENRLFWS